MKKQDIEEDSIKRGAGTVYGFMGGLARKMGMVLLRGLDTPMYTIYAQLVNIHSLISDVL